MEKYIIINEFDNYAISNLGNIKNVKTGRVLKLCLNPRGYYSYTFYKKGIRKTFRIHRLVALYFIDNPNNLPYVNHIDGNKTNNRVENLEWCTAKQNDEHARRTGLKVQEKPVLAENVESGEKIAFKSVSEAGAILGINKGTISKVLHGKRNKVHGYKFYFI
jgi:hypothetical protein